MDMVMIEFKAGALVMILGPDKVDAAGNATTTLQMADNMAFQAGQAGSAGGTLYH
jgi:hypothetical protein